MNRTEDSSQLYSYEAHTHTEHKHDINPSLECKGTKHDRIHDHIDSTVKNEEVRSLEHREANCSTNCCPVVNFFSEFSIEREVLVLCAPVDKKERKKTQVRLDVTMF